METVLDKKSYGEGDYEEKKEYGGFWLRFAAYLIDSIILGIPLGIITLLIFTLFFGAFGTFELILADPYADITDEQALALLGSYFGAFAIAFLINMAGVIAYYAGLHSSKWQATVGKKLLGLKVTDLNGNRISFWRALGRYLSLAFLSGILLIGFIIAAFTEKKQALHDLIAGTVVVKK
ncbi:RDD family protein [Bacillus sp. FJAT-49705]|uniref:RDD family protein n=1 Tax=Cytobacillus citreus TaxID=2833586 RepID=A0ABS5NMK0_9BACI|nr:RDD family protein [Cytobacillus citreus]